MKINKTNDIVKDWKPTLGTDCEFSAPGDRAVWETAILVGYSHSQVTPFVGRDKDRRVKFYACARPIHDERLAHGWNPNGLNNAQVDVKNGYRLLEESELRNRHNHFKEIEFWTQDTFMGSCIGNDKTMTYRTKLTKEALEALDPVKKVEVSIAECNSQSDSLAEGKKPTTESPTKRVMGEDQKAALELMKKVILSEENYPREILEAAITLSQYNIEYGVEFQIGTIHTGNVYDAVRDKHHQEWLKQIQVTQRQSDRQAFLQLKADGGYNSFQDPGLLKEWNELNKQMGLI